MIYQIDPRIFLPVPDFRRGVIAATQVDNTSTVLPKLDQLFRERIQNVMDDPSVTLDHPRIRAWQELYQSQGTQNMRKARPSIGALVKRVKAGAGAQIPFVSPLVCISNLISLTFLVPSGLVDAAQVAGGLNLGYADGSETFEPFGGSGLTTPEPGEIIYYDSASRNVMCGSWNSRGGKATSIQSTTTTAVIDVDCLGRVMSLEEHREALDEMSDLLRDYCGARTLTYFLNQAAPTCDISLS